MKTAAVLLILAICGLGLVSATSCFVSRQSERYACNTDAECDNGRTCDRGYCVPAACPSQCSSCDLIDKTCRIECGTGRPCASVQCPTGYDCTIRCSNANACGNIDCSQGKNCDITCAAPSACQSITCGASPCAIDCSGVSGCGTIDCAASCRCDVTCNNNACPSVSCPLVLGAPCAQGQVPDAPCDSTAIAGCDRCL